jgi:hypothetical protein
MTSVTQLKRLKTSAKTIQKLQAILPLTLLQKPKVKEDFSVKTTKLWAVKNTLGIIFSQKAHTRQLL